MELYIPIAVLVSYLVHWVTAEFQCTSSQNCICSTVLTNYEFQCPMEEPEIVMTVYPNYGTSVQCHKKISWDSPNLPHADIGDVLFTMFRTCSFSNNTFLEVMHRLGIKSTKQLKVDYSSDFENMTLAVDYFRGLNNLEKLILNSNDIAAIDENVFKSLDSLIEIDLTYNKLQLTPTMFQYLSKLKLLDLSKNELSYLPPGLFQNLTELGVLSMWSNNLTVLNRNIFENLKNLKTLELLDNQLQDLPDDIFHDLENLKIVSLAQNKLQRIPPSLFAKNANLGGINLSRNIYLTYLPDGLFSNLTKLENITLHDCKLSELPSDIFRGSLNIKNIYLQRNKLEQLPGDIFKGLTELNSLDLSGNKLKELPGDVFSSLTQLKSLNLQDNMLESIGGKLFFSLYNVEMLNLGNNRIRLVDKHTFKTMVELKTIILSHNYINLDETQAVSPFNNNLNLEKADLSYNNLSSISEDWMESKTHLKELDMSHNQITYVEFSNMMAVSRSLVIDLSNNKISTVNFHRAELIARNQGNLDAYTSNSANNVVYLNENPIECDCNIYDFVRYFERNIDPMVPTLVTVKADKLTCAAPANFVGNEVKNLKSNMLTCTLDQLQDNSTCPEKCECGIRLWDKAFIVNCKNKNLTEAPALVLPVEDIVNQTIVHLQGNLLTSGPKPNMGYENVTKLYLSLNKINEITWVPPKIEVLNVDNNNISSVSYEVLTMLNASTVTNISLGNNPWRCDCLALNFSAFVVSHLTSKQIDANDIRCRDRNKLLVHLSNNDLCPTYTALVLGTSITFALIALVVAVLAAIFYRNEQKIRVWLFAHKMCLWCVTEEEVDKDKLYDAFISYSHKDEEFVINKLVSELEKGPHPYKLCLHIRDWVAGEFIPKQIVRSVEESRRTLVVLSSSFLQSVWGKMEFRTAHTQAMAEGRARVIVILYGDINVDDLDDELKAYIKTNTYVKWGDPWFWDKLKYALPHSRVKVGRRLQKNHNIMISLNDKIDLITSIQSTPNPGSTPPAINVEPPLLLKNNPLNFQTTVPLTPPAESGLNPLLVTVNK